MYLPPLASPNLQSFLEPRSMKLARPRQPRSTLFPYTTLFRSNELVGRTGWNLRRRYQVERAGDGDDDNRIRTHHHSRRARAFDNLDRKSTRLNSSHANISYAVFCLKKIKGRCICLRSPVLTCKAF